MSSESRRSFMRRLASGSALAIGAPRMLTSASPMTRTDTLDRVQQRSVSPNDSIQLAVIGAGGMGSADVSTALSIPSVKLVAACDLYDARLAPREDATDHWPWNDIFTTRDYREVLSRSDVDAVLVGTPDHWHRQISIDAMEAGKAVYCEKPMVHAVDEGADVVAAQRRTGSNLPGRQSGHEQPRKREGQGAVRGRCHR